MLACRMSSLAAIISNCFSRASDALQCMWGFCGVFPVTTGARNGDLQVAARQCLNVSFSVIDDY